MSNGSSNNVRVGVGSKSMDWCNRGEYPGCKRVFIDSSGKSLERQVWDYFRNEKYIVLKLSITPMFLGIIFTRGQASLSLTFLFMGILKAVFLTSLGNVMSGAAPLCCCCCTPAGPAEKVCTCSGSCWLASAGRWWPPLPFSMMGRPGVTWASWLGDCWQPRHVNIE